tara:strand:- start:2675 stop:3574 length:900 start_codon:yes stop_codon:yes gene_type:complete
MRETTVREVFHRIVAKRNYDISTNTLTAADRINVGDLVNIIVRKAWESAWWPELMLLEERQYRVTWSDSSNYGIGDEVYFVDSDDAGGYYVSLLDSNVNKSPETETTYWSAVGEDFVRSIHLRQEWEANEIGMLDMQAHLFARNPDIYPETIPLESVYLRGDEIFVRPDQAPTKPYVKFRKPRPRYSWVEWDVAAAYAIGDLVYQTVAVADSLVVGETFKALTANTGKEPYTQTVDWVSVPFPEFLVDYVVQRVAAEERTEDEGRRESFGLAAEILDSLMQAHIDAQGPRRPAVYQVGS